MISNNIFQEVFSFAPIHSPHLRYSFTFNYRKLNLFLVFSVFLYCPQMELSRFPEEGPAYETATKN